MIDSTRVHVYTMAASFAIPDLIVKKRNGQALTTEEIKYFIQEVVNGGIQQCQLGKREREIERFAIYRSISERRERFTIYRSISERS